MGLAASLFNGTSENSVIRRITPTPEQREFLQKQWNALADTLKPALQARSNLPVSTWIQGSYKYGTLLRPVSSDQEYDVDLGIYFEWGPEEKLRPSPRQLREWVHQELKDYAANCEEIRGVEEPPKEWCSRTKYIAKFHIDTPVYHHDLETKRARIASLNNRWEDRDPEPLYNWFLGVVEDSRRDQLRRIVRYLKAWAVVAFEGVRNAAPSSVMLSVLAAEALRDLLAGGMTATDDDDVLREVSIRIHLRLQSNRAVRNPVDTSRPQEDLNRIPEDLWQECQSRLTALYESAIKAAAAEDEAGAAHAWSQAFSYLMPLPEAEEQEVVDNNGTALMQVPDVRIDVFDETTNRHIVTHTNDVPAVTKRCRLHFSIATPGVIPPGAAIEWTVRNSDLEAENVGDLGHRRTGVGLFQMEEVTRYAGTQYMDCVVLVNRSVYALRRVRVNIVNFNLPSRNPPKRPSFTRIRTRRR
jgi:hypothetical protein